MAYDLIGKYAWIYDQMKYCILSLLSVEGVRDIESKCNIIVYTNQPDRIGKISEVVDVRVHNDRQIISSMGKYRYFHRYRTDTLIKFASENTQSIMVYMDTDMYFKIPILHRFENIKSGVMGMNTCESSLFYGNAKPRIQRLAREVAGDIIAQCNDRDIWLYNGGVIALHPDDFELLNDNIDLMDKGLDYAECHIWEQLSLSIALARRKMKVETYDREIHHYWDQRDEYTAAITPIIRHIEDKNMPIQDAVEYVRNHPLNVPPYRRQSLPIRLWRKITGLSRMPSIRIQDDIKKI